MAFGIVITVMSVILIKSLARRNRVPNGLSFKGDKQLLLRATAKSDLNTIELKYALNGLVIGNCASVRHQLDSQSLIESGIVCISGEMIEGLNKDSCWIHCYNSLRDTLSIHFLTVSEDGEIAQMTYLPYGKVPSYPDPELITHIVVSARYVDRDVWVSKFGVRNKNKVIDRSKGEALELPDFGDITAYVEDRSGITSNAVLLFRRHVLPTDPPK